MLRYFYKISIYGGLFAILILSTTGLAAASPGLATLPFFLVALMIPIFVFSRISQRIVFLETARRITNRGFEKIGTRAESTARNLDNIDALKLNLNRLNLEGFSVRSAAIPSAKMVKARALASDFSRSFMPKARLSMGNFRNARFINANLKKSKLRYGNFKNADFSGADLSDTNLKGADLTGANLNGANLKGAVINQKTVLPIKKEEAFKRGAIAV